MQFDFLGRHHNLGAVIAADVADDQPWLIEVAPDGAERHFSYADLHRLVARNASALRARGLPPGARVGVLADNCADYAVLFFAILQAGYCCVPINRRLTREGIAYILEDADVRLLIADEEWFAPFEGKVSMPLVRLDALDVMASGAAPADFEPSVPDGDDFAAIMYTSGSSGKPKGVPLTHHGYIWTLQHMDRFWARRFHAGVPPTTLTAMPLFHMNALLNTQLSTAYGGTIIVMKKFTADALLRNVERYRSSAVTAVPTMFALCARETDTLAQVDVSSVRNCGVNSAPVTVEMLRAFERMFPNATVTNVWGTTETGLAVFAGHPEGKPTPLGSLGHAIDAVELRLDGDTPDHGELYVRSPAVLPGYVNRPEVNRERLHDGWYRTGDIMRCDADGFYYFLGRADDMFVCSGENIYPQEVEELLERHAGIAQAAVVPVPDRVKGMIPAAFIVRAAGSTLGEDDVKQYALTNGPVYAYPRFVRFIEHMPLGSTGKVDKKAIAAMASGLHR